VRVENDTWGLTLCTVACLWNAVWVEEGANGEVTDTSRVPNGNAGWVAEVSSLELVRSVVHDTVIVELLSWVLVVDVTSAKSDVVHRVLNRPLYIIALIRESLKKQNATTKTIIVIIKVNTHDTAVYWVLTHTDNISQPPSENLTTTSILDWAGHNCLDAECLDHASAGRLGRGGGVNVLTGATSDEQHVGVRLDGEESSSRMGSSRAHTRNDSLSSSYSSCNGVVGIGCHGVHV
jgi:hypothetical protein